MPSSPLICDALSQQDVEAFYVGFNNLFSIKLHHGGLFKGFPGCVYAKGSTDFVDLVDIDKFSVHEMDIIMGRLEYSKDEVRYYHYLVPNANLGDGIRPLGTVLRNDNLEGNIKDSDLNANVAKLVDVNADVNANVTGLGGNAGENSDLGEDSDHDDGNHVNDTEADTRDYRLLPKDNDGEYVEVFGTKEEVKLMIKEHVVNTKREIWVIKDDDGRVRAICKGISDDGGHNKKFDNVGTGSSISVKVRAVQEQFQRQYDKKSSLMKAFGAKTIAMEQIHGDFSSQYGKLRDYVEELMRANPGTTVKLQVESSIDPTSPERKFKKIYVCLGSLKQVFKEIGRELLGLDGAFLKRPFPG
ncbi:hypothetical protein SSX86_029908 [Deinandra increscens subsp. villosa]|uniref:PB1-like domain-containing protein n=1 Tax=Deinandra increscens subsp. villosa TaxID=3103831 RepID=A0AAP0CBG1_9ASTR